MSLNFKINLDAIIVVGAGVCGWLGARNENAGSSTFYWESDNSIFDSNLWDPPEPSDTNVLACLYIYHSQTLKHRLHDYPCSSTTLGAYNNGSLCAHSARLRRVINP